MHGSCTSILVCSRSSPQGSNNTTRHHSTKPSLPPHRLLPRPIVERFRCVRSQHPLVTAELVPLGRCDLPLLYILAREVDVFAKHVAHLFRVLPWHGTRPPQPSQQATTQQGCCIRDALCAYGSTCPYGTDRTPPGAHSDSIAMPTRRAAAIGTRGLRAARSCRTSRPAGSSPTNAPGNDSDKNVESEDTCKCCHQAREQCGKIAVHYSVLSCIGAFRATRS